MMKSTSRYQAPPSNELLHAAVRNWVASEETRSSAATALRMFAPNEPNVPGLGHETAAHRDLRPRFVHQLSRFLLSRLCVAYDTPARRIPPTDVASRDAAWRRILWDGRLGWPAVDVSMDLADRVSRLHGCAAIRVGCLPDGHRHGPRVVLRVFGRNTFDVVREPSTGEVLAVLLEIPWPKQQGTASVAAGYTAAIADRMTTKRYECWTADSLFILDATISAPISAPRFDLEQHVIEERPNPAGRIPIVLLESQLSPWGSGADADHPDAALSNLPAGLGLDFVCTCESIQLMMERLGWAACLSSGQPYWKANRDITGKFWNSPDAPLRPEIEEEVGVLKQNADLRGMGEVVERQLGVLCATLGLQRDLFAAVTSTQTDVRDERDLGGSAPRDLEQRFIALSDAERAIHEISALYYPTELGSGEVSTVFSRPKWILGPRQLDQRLGEMLDRGLITRADAISEYFPSLTSEETRAYAERCLMDREDWSRHLIAIAGHVEDVAGLNKSLATTANRLPGVSSDSGRAADARGDSDSGERASSGTVIRSEPTSGG